jgi:hypothetical protein
MRECLVCLDTPQHKGKRQIRRPFAITSGIYQEVADRHLSKAGEVKGEQVQKGNEKMESKKGR